MTPTGVPQDILEIARRAGEASGARAVYLFGSRARGEARPDSDVDLLLVVPDGANLIDAAMKAYRANRKRGRAVDFVPMTETHFNNRDSIIAREGVSVYG